MHIQKELLDLFERFVVEEKFTNRSEAAQMMVSYMLGITYNETEAQGVRLALDRIHPSSYAYRKRDLPVAKDLVKMLKGYESRIRSR